MMKKQEKETQAAKRPAEEPLPKAASGTPAARAEAEEPPHPGEQQKQKQRMKTGKNEKGISNRMNPGTGITQHGFARGMQPRELALAECDIKISLPTDPPGRPLSYGSVRCFKPV